MLNVVIINFRNNLFVKYTIKMPYSKHIIIFFYMIFLVVFYFFFSFSIFKNYLEDHTSYYKKNLSKFSSQSIIIIMIIVH